MRGENKVARGTKFELMKACVEVMLLSRNPPNSAGALRLTQDAGLPAGEAVAVQAAPPIRGGRCSSTQADPGRVLTAPARLAGRRRAFMPALAVDAGQRS